MKHLSYWAKHHPRQARAIIVAAHTIVATAAFKGGLWLYARHDVAWPIWLFPLLLLLTFWVKSAYPTKPLTETEIASDHRYWRSRRVLLGMTLCAWLLMLLAGNRTAQWSEQPASAASVTERSPTAYGQMPFLMTDGGQVMHAKAAFKWLKAKKKTYFEKKVRHIRQRAAAGGSGEMDAVGQVLLTLLTLVVALFLAYLIAGLACNLSCSGQEGLAIIVALVGGGLLIWGVIAALIGIWEKKEGGGIPAPPGEPVPRRPPSKKM